METTIAILTGLTLTSVGIFIGIRIGIRHVIGCCRCAIRTAQVITRAHLSPCMTFDTHGRHHFDPKDLKISPETYDVSEDVEMPDCEGDDHRPFCRHYREPLKGPKS